MPPDSALLRRQQEFNTGNLLIRRDVAKAKVAARYPDLVFRNQQYPLVHFWDVPAPGAKETKLELTLREWGGIGNHAKELEKHPIC